MFSMRQSHGLDDRTALTRRQVLHLVGMATLAAGARPLPLGAQGPTFPKGAVIRALLGDHTPDEFAGSATLFHEHVSVAPDFMERFFAATAAVQAAAGAPPAAGPGRGGRAAGPGRGGAAAAPDAMRNIDLMVEELRRAKSAGVACLVDAGTVNMGRDVEFVRQASMRSGMPVVAGCGYYSQPYYPPEVAKMSEGQLVDAIVKQADDLPGGALGEIGSWDEMTPDERKVFRAVGKAHVATNLPIFTHTGIPGKAAIEQLNILEDAGVAPNRVCIGHLGNLVDANLYVHKALCRRGAFVGFDRLGGGNDAPQVPLIMGLIEAGFADNILLSSDSFNGYGKTVTAFLPRLQAAGAPDDVARRIMHDNPRRFLAFVPRRPRRKQ
jgi:phosphotriesterase-related protein